MGLAMAGQCKAGRGGAGEWQCLVCVDGVGRKCREDVEEPVEQERCSGIRHRCMLPRHRGTAAKAARDSRIKDSGYDEED